METASQVEEKVYRVRAPDMLYLSDVGNMTGILTYVHPVLDGAAIDMAVRHLRPVAPGDICVYAMCRGRHRVENRVG